MSARGRADHLWPEPVSQTVSPTPVPERITQALDFQGLYGPEVDLACGVEEPTVDQWESGAVVPTEEQIQLLAALTGYAPQWFYLVPARLEGLTFLCGKRCTVVVEPPTISAEDRELVREAARRRRSRQ